MYTLPETLESRFKLYLNVLPFVEQGAMYLFFIIGVILILLTVYRLTFKVLFKTLDKSTKKQRNIIIGTDLWIEKERNIKNQRTDKDHVYTACEIPLSDDNTETDESQETVARRQSGFIKSHGDRIKELSYRLSDKVYDSIGSVKDKVKDYTHVKNIFKDERKNSLLPQNNDDSITNDAYKSDSGDDCEHKQSGVYAAVRQSDSEDDFRYLEVIDDGSGFDDVSIQRESDRCNKLNRLELEGDKDELIYISDWNLDDLSWKCHWNIIVPSYSVCSTFLVEPWKSLIYSPDSSAIPISSEYFNTYFFHNNYTELFLTLL